jgi:hypothetical protein
MAGVLDDTRNTMTGTYINDGHHGSIQLMTIKVVVTSDRASGGGVVEEPAKQFTMNSATVRVDVEWSSTRS